MIQRRSMHCLWGLLLLMLFFSSMPVICLGAMRLDAPAATVRGSAFMARAWSEARVGEFVFFWLGKRLAAQASQHGNGLWQASILLPVPLEQKQDTLQLGVAGVSQGKRDRTVPALTADIRLLHKKRPVQKLTVDRKYVDPPADEQTRIKGDREKVRQALAQYLPGRRWTLPLARPVPGSVSSLFGLRRVFNGQPRSMHRGLDLRGAEGTPVQACADGRVVLADDLYFSGNAVYLNHGEGVFTAYLHLSRILVRQGQDIRRGEVIGLVGATGRVTGPHLHLSLTVQGHAADPEPLLAEHYFPLPGEKATAPVRAVRKEAGQ